MLIKRAQELKYSDITPKSVYMNRRKFLAEAGIVGGAVLAGRGIWNLISPSESVLANAKLNVASKSPLECWKFQDVSVDGFGGRRVRQAAEIFDGRYFENGAA
jgi:hypothetical protein